MAIPIKQKVKNSIKFINTYFKEWIQLNRIRFEESIVTWNNYQSGSIHNKFYAAQYQYLLDHGQYSLLLKDHSLIQFYYEFNSEETLKNGKLAFYPNPKNRFMEEEIFSTLKKLENNLEVEMREELYTIINWEPSESFYSTSLRFDFDSMATTHDKSHIQFDGLDDIRLTCSTFLTPLEFMDFLFHQWPPFKGNFANLLNDEKYQNKIKQVRLKTSDLNIKPFLENLILVRKDEF